MISRGFCRGILLDLDGFRFLGLVDFLVLPRPECQPAGLASPRESVRTDLSVGEAGVTLVDFPAGSFAESMDVYDWWFCALF